MSKFRRGIVAVSVFSLLAAGGVLLLRAGVYGYTVFALIPVLLGGLAAWVFRPSTSGRAAGVGALAPIVALFGLLALGMEGLVCIAFAAPLAAPLGAFGGWMAFHLEHSRARPRHVALILLLPPASLTWDATARPTVYEVNSAIEIAAPPEQVWQHVVAFSEMPAPAEWYFHTGLAYPVRTRIEGTGAGAVRYCEFSTGAIVEPIEVWDPPRRLQFRVTESPAPMREWSPYGEISPRHLRGYLVSKRGRFLLTPLSGNRTLVEGTSWYQHGLWPAEYWRWWSDAVIHRIHGRVLNHIRDLAEAR